MKKLFVCWLSMLVIFVFLIGGTQVTGAKEIVLKLGHITAPGGMMDREAQKFKELVEAKSTGKLRIDVYPAAQLGKIREILEGLSMGTVDMALEGMGFLGQFDKDFNFFNAPFMFKSPQAISQHPYLNELLEKIRKANGIRTLSQNGFRPEMHLWTKTKPVQSLEDLKGIKLRMPGVKAYVDVWNGLGATATVIPWSEVYMALAQNVVDGMVHNCLQIRDEKFYEHLKYATLLDFKPVLNCIWISEMKHNSLPADIQKILNEAAVDAGEYFTKMAKIDNEKAWDDVKKAGIKVYTVDRAPWFKKAHAVHIKMEESGSWGKGLLDRIKTE